MRATVLSSAGHFSKDVLSRENDNVPFSSEAVSPLASNCLQCKSPLATGWKFCMICGAHLSPQDFVGLQLPDLSSLSTRARVFSTRVCQAALEGNRRTLQSIVQAAVSSLPPGMTVADFLNMPSVASAVSGVPVGLSIRRRGPGLFALVEPSGIPAPALVFAVVGNHTDCVQYLVESGASPLAPCSAASTASSVSALSAPCALELAAHLHRGQAYRIMEHCLRQILGVAHADDACSLSSPSLFGDADLGLAESSQQRLAESRVTPRTPPSGSSDLSMANARLETQRRPSYLLETVSPSCVRRSSSGDVSIGQPPGNFDDLLGGLHSTSPQTQRVSGKSVREPSRKRDTSNTASGASLGAALASLGPSPLATDSSSSVPAQAPQGLSVPLSLPAPKATGSSTPSPGALRVPADSLGLGFPSVLAVNVHMAAQGARRGNHALPVDVMDALVSLSEVRGSEDVEAINSAVNVVIKTIRALPGQLDEHLASGILCHALSLPVPHEFLEVFASADRSFQAATAPLPTPLPAHLLDSIVSAVAKKSPAIDPTGTPLQTEGVRNAVLCGAQATLEVLLRLHGKGYGLPQQHRRSEFQLTSSSSASTLSNGASANAAALALSTIYTHNPGLTLPIPGIIKASLNTLADGVSQSVISQDDLKSILKPDVALQLPGSASPVAGSHSPMAVALATLSKLIDARADAKSSKDAACSLAQAGPLFETLRSTINRKGFRDLLRGPAAAQLAIKCIALGDVETLQLLIPVLTDSVLDAINCPLKFSPEDLKLLALFPNSEKSPDLLHQIASQGLVTPLMAAILADNAVAARLLLSAGADISATLSLEEAAELALVLKESHSTMSEVVSRSVHAQKQKNARSEREAASASKMVAAKARKANSRANLVGLRPASPSRSPPASAGGGLSSLKIFPHSAGGGPLSLADAVSRRFSGDRGPLRLPSSASTSGLLNLTPSAPDPTRNTNDKQNKQNTSSAKPKRDALSLNIPGRESPSAAGKTVRTPDVNISPSTSSSKAGPVRGKGAARMAASTASSTSPQSPESPNKASVTTDETCKSKTEPVSKNSAAKSVTRDDEANDAVASCTGRKAEASNLETLQMITPVAKEVLDVLNSFGDYVKASKSELDDAVRTSIQPLSRFLRIIMLVNQKKSQIPSPPEVLSKCILAIISCLANVSVTLVTHLASAGIAPQPSPRSKVFLNFLGGMKIQPGSIHDVDLHIAAIIFSLKLVVTPTFLDNNADVLIQPALICLKMGYFVSFLELSQSEVIASRLSGLSVLEALHSSIISIHHPSRMAGASMVLRHSLLKNRLESSQEACVALHKVMELILFPGLEALQYLPVKASQATNRALTKEAASLLSQSMECLQMAQEWSSVPCFTVIPTSAHPAWSRPNILQSIIRSLEGTTGAAVYYKALFAELLKMDGVSEQINEVLENGDTLLTTAVAVSSVDAVSLLLQVAEISYKAAAKNGDTPLDIARGKTNKQPRDTEILSILEATSAADGKTGGRWARQGRNRARGTTISS